MFHYASNTIEIFFWTYFLNLLIDMFNLILQINGEKFFGATISDSGLFGRCGPNFAVQTHFLTQMCCSSSRLRRPVASGMTPGQAPPTPGYAVADMTIGPVKKVASTPRTLIRETLKVCKPQIRSCRRITPADTINPFSCEKVMDPTRVTRSSVAAQPVQPPTAQVDASPSLSTTTTRRQSSGRLFRVTTSTTSVPPTPPTIKTRRASLAQAHADVEASLNLSSLVPTSQVGIDDTVSLNTTNLGKGFITRTFERAATPRTNIRNFISLGSLHTILLSQLCLVQYLFHSVDPNQLAPRKSFLELRRSTFLR